MVTGRLSLLRKAGRPVCFWRHKLKHSNKQPIKNRCQAPILYGSLVFFGLELCSRRGLQLEDDQGHIIMLLRAVDKLICRAEELIDHCAAVLFAA